MKLEYFEYLVTIEQCRSIREAARQLYLKPQYLSNVVKNMEAHFGITIFERHVRGIVPTEDGLYLLNKIRSLLAIYNEMQLDFLYPSRQEKMQIQQDLIVYTRDVVNISNLVNVLDRIREYFPNVNIFFKSKSNQEILTSLINEPNSLGIIYNVSGKEMDFPEQLTAITFAKKKMALYADSKNVKARRIAAVSLKDAVQYNLVVYAPNGLADSMTYELLHPYGELNIKYITDNAAIMLSLLKKGDYYCVMAGLENKDELIEIPFAEDSVSLSAFIVYNKQEEQSFLISSVLKILQIYKQEIFA